MNAQNLRQRQPQRHIGATSMAAAYLFAAIFSAGLLSGCDNKASKEAEDVARIRALMEKQEAEKQEQEVQRKAHFDQLRKDAARQAAQAGVGR